ncbi:hypothetical protein [Entomohabitans teleogrylli]|uniref:hypothetical protein n=1 Tax=Entomohabitans teleogrylli TaxID=1384589 RepID=UPI00073D2331|nr:hypothetical protein [Entomohabitans teleogrylli]
MDLNSVLKYVVKKFLITELAVALLVALWLLYTLFIPEYWIEFMIPTIIIVVVLHVKLAQGKKSKNGQVKR